MNLETFQYQLEGSILCFVNLGKSMVDSYQHMYPSLKATGMFNLLLAARNMSSQVTRAVRLQKMSIPEVTRLNLVEIKGKLQNLITYFEQGDFDLEITYKYNEASAPLFDPDEIVAEENLDLAFPDAEKTKGFVSARKYLIENMGSVFQAVVDCTNSVIEKLEILICDWKIIRRNAEQRMTRMEAMEQFYLKHNWPEEKQILQHTIDWELKEEANKDKTDVQILQTMIRTLENDNETNCVKKLLKEINQHKLDREKVALLIAENRSKYSFDDVMAHLRYRESIKLLQNKIGTIKLLTPCDAYQGKLFVNNAAYQAGKMLGRFFYNYVGFDKKVKAAFSCAAMMDVGMIADENNARLMADFINNEWLGEKDSMIKDDDITKPLRKCAKHRFCTIDENNLRSFELKEFERYKDLYWRAFSIINKVLVISDDLEKVSYLNEIHPAIDEIDVESYLSDEEKTILNLINSDGGLKWG